MDGKLSKEKLDPETMRTSDGNYLVYKKTYVPIDFLESNQLPESTLVGRCDDLSYMVRRVDGGIKALRKGYPALPSSAKIDVKGQWETPRDIFVVGAGAFPGRGKLEWDLIDGFLVDVMPTLRLQIAREQEEWLEGLRRGSLQG